MSQNTFVVAAAIFSALAAAICLVYQQHDHNPDNRARNTTRTYFWCAVGLGFCGWMAL